MVLEVHVAFGSIEYAVDLVISEFWAVLGYGALVGMVPVQIGGAHQNTIVNIFAEKGVSGHYHFLFLPLLLALTSSPWLLFFNFENVLIDKVFVWGLRRFNFYLVLCVIPYFEYPGFSLAREIVLADANIDV